MSKAEQILYDRTGMDAKNHSDIMEAMKLYAEHYHKEQLKKIPSICKRCDTIIRTELNQDY